MIDAKEREGGAARRRAPAVPRPRLLLDRGSVVAGWVGQGPAAGGEASRYAGHVLVGRGLQHRLLDHLFDVVVGDGLRAVAGLLGQQLGDGVHLDLSELAAQQAEEMVPDGVSVVAALHTVSAPVLGDPDAELDEDVLICGDRKADKARVARIVERIPGLRAVNAGALETARIVEQITPLLISINVRYKTHAGIRITGLPGGDPWE